MFQAFFCFTKEIEPAHPSSDSGSIHSTCTTVWYLLDLKERDLTSSYAIEVNLSFQPINLLGFNSFHSYGRELLSASLLSTSAESWRISSSELDQVFLALLD